MTQPQQSREERLAAKLRENLRRRKAQARALNDVGHEDDDDGTGGGTNSESPSGIETENESGALSKSRPES